MNKKRILALAAVVSILSGAMAHAEYDPDKVIDTSSPIMTLSAEAEEINEAPVLNGVTLPSISAKDVNGVIMIPLRELCEGLGYEVNWIGETRSVDLIKGAHYIKVSLDNNEFSFSRRAPESLEAAPTLVGDLTYVPLSFVDRIVGGYYVENEDETYKIVLPSIVTLKEITEEGSILVSDEAIGEVLVHIDETTLITKGKDRRLYTVEDLKVGMVLAVEYSPAMTMSIPAQTLAVRINIENLDVLEDVPQEEIVEETEVQTLSFEGEITAIEENIVTIGNPVEDAKALALVISDDTVISKGLDKRIYGLDDLQVGMKISGTHAEQMTMSIPAQTVALEIKIND